MGSFCQPAICNCIHHAITFSLQSPPAALVPRTRASFGDKSPYFAATLGNGASLSPSCLHHNRATDSGPQRHSPPAAKEASLAKSVAKEASPAKDVSTVVATAKRILRKSSITSVLAGSATTTAMGTLWVMLKNIDTVPAVHFSADLAYG